VFWKIQRRIRSPSFYQGDNLFNYSGLLIFTFDFKYSIISFWPSKRRTSIFASYAQIGFQIHRTRNPTNLSMVGQDPCGLDESAAFGFNCKRRVCVAARLVPWTLRPCRTIIYMSLRQITGFPLQVRRTRPDTIRLSFIQLCVGNSLYPALLLISINYLFAA
jgi:hypothetical protein